MAIGGEFEIDPLLFQRGKQTEEKTIFYSSGRAALYQIMKALYPKNTSHTVFLPDYLCGSVVEAVTRAGWRIDYYPVLADLKPDMDFLLSRIFCDEAILLINYYGGIDLQPDIAILKQFNSDVFVIQDNVQSLYSMYEPTGADACFTSFRKTVPMPDGACVKIKSLHLEHAVQPNTFAAYKLMGGVLKQHKQYANIPDERYLQLFEQGEDLIDADLDSVVSEVSLRILSNLNLQEIARRRKTNAVYLINRLREIGVTPILEFNDEMIPLFVPIKVKNRNELRRKLAMESIYCPCHWPCANDALIMGREMAEHELSLIVDQRYNEEDMDSIVNVLEKNYGRIYHG